MPNLDIKKLITGFLILAAVVSSSAFLFSGFIGNNVTTENPEQNQGDKPFGSTQGKVPDNVFVEPIPANGISKSAESANGTGEGLPRVGDSPNLTDRLAQNLTRGIVENNPNGPDQSTSGEISLDTSDLESVIKKTFVNENLRKLAANDWKVGVSDSDLKIIKNYKLEDFENYSRSINQIFNDNLADSKLTGLLQDEQYSSEAVNAISLALDQADIDLRKLSVPKPFLNFHKSLLTLLAYQKNAVGAVTSEDPIKGSLEMQNEEKNYNLALANFENELGKLNSVIKNSSLKQDPSSFLSDLFAIKSAHAFFLFTFDAAHFARIVWEWLQKHILQIVKNQLVHKIMAQTLNWIKGNGNPQFVTNWKTFLGQTGNEAAGVAINKYLPNLCQSFGPLIKLQLTNPYLSSPVVTCTLDQIVQNVKNFYNDFSQGSWIGYSAMILPSGNYFGSLFETTQKIGADKLAAKSAAKSDAESSKGFLSTKKCVKNRQASDFDECISGCVNFVGPQPVGAPPCVQSCAGLSTVPNARECTDYQNTTPGEVAANAVDTAIAAPLHNIVNAQDIVGIISAAVDSMISKLFQNGLKGLLGLTMKDSISGKEPPPPGIVDVPTATISCGSPGTGNATDTPPMVANNLSNVDFVDAANVSGWNQTARLSSVTIDSDPDGKICLNYDKANDWPAIDPGIGANAVANPWIMVYRGGKWQATTFSWFRPGQTCKSVGDVFFGGLSGSKTFGDFAPVAGETYGFMVSGIARDSYTNNIQERSNVLMATWNGPGCITSTSGGELNPHLTPNHTADVRSARDTLGNPPGPCGAFQIIKSVAKKIGAGLLLTDLTSDENYCKGYSADNIVFSDGWLIDALGDGGGDNNPQWNDNGTTAACSYKNCRFVPANSPSLP